MARERDEYGRTVDAVNFDAPLCENLAKLGVTISKLPDEKDAALRQWAIPGRVLGKFDAHFGWVVLRHYNLCGDWLISIREAQGEFYYGYGQSGEEAMNIPTGKPTQ